MMGNVALAGRVDTCRPSVSRQLPDVPAPSSFPPRRTCHYFSVYRAVRFPAGSVRIQQVGIHTGTYWGRDET